MIIPSPLRLSQQAGVSMVAVVVAMAIISISVASISVGYNNLYAARRSAAASSAERDIQGAIVQSVTEGYRAYVQGKCGTALKPKIETIAIGNLAKLTASQKIVLPGASGGSSGGDRLRCKITPFSASTAAQSSAFYRCYKITLPPYKAAKIDKASFLANQGAFIEVLVHPMDLRTDLPTTCVASSQTLSSGYGVEIYYSLHWVLNSNQGLLYKTKVGSINVTL